MPGHVRKASEAYQQLEAVMLKQMLQSSGAFRAGSAPGAQLQTDMFVETLADAVAKAGGLGIAKMLERELGGPGALAPGGAKGNAASGSDAGVGGAAVAGAHQLAHRGDPHELGRLLLAPRVNPAAGSLPIAPTASGGAVDTVDAVDDPNSEAPLPEDPSAPSIDDYQVASPTLAPGRIPGARLMPAQALNRYRQRAEDLYAGTPSSTAARKTQ